MNKVESALSRTTDTKALVIGIETLPRVADMFKEPVSYTHLTLPTKA